MKKIVFIILFAFSIIAKSQVALSLKGNIIEDINPSLVRGSAVILSGINFSESSGSYQAILNKDGKSISIEAQELSKIKIRPSNAEEFWQNQALKNGVYHNIAKNGFQYTLRKELEQEALEFLNFAENNDLLFNDSYLESYLYSLAYKIYPFKIGDGRPGVFNLKILKDTEPDAFMFSSGTMFITTGLLSVLNSEEELIAILAKKISSFVLDHSIININKEKERKEKAEFWSNTVNGVAKFIDKSLIGKDKYQTPGKLTTRITLTANLIKNLFIERMGLAFSKKQEFDSDNCVRSLLIFKNIDPKLFSSALLKIRDYNIKNGNYKTEEEKRLIPSLEERLDKMLAPKPSIEERIKHIGLAKAKPDNADYDKKISFVNSFNAVVQLNKHHLEACSELVIRNIKADVATEEDYVLLAMVNILTHDTEERNLQALNYIEKAKELNVYPTINLHKQEAIVLIRLKRFEKAKEALKTYINELEKLDSTKINEFLNNEKEWSLKMINKVAKL